MIEFSVVIEDNDYLWNRSNGQLVRYQVAGSVVMGAISSESSVCVAFPIPLDEDVLRAVEFIPNDKGEYIREDLVIKIDGTKSKSILQIDETPICYISDIQNFYRSHKGGEMEINEEKLTKACQKYTCKPQPLTSPTPPAPHTPLSSASLR